MDPVHYMFPEDEIFLCAVVLAYGIVAGAVTRLLVAWRGRRAA